MATITTHVTVCDRCKKTLELNQRPRPFSRCVARATLITHYTSDPDIDLCPDCYRDFLAFMKEGASRAPQS